MNSIACAADEPSCQDDPDCKGCPDKIQGLVVPSRLEQPSYPSLAPARPHFPGGSSGGECAELLSSLIAIRE